MTPRSRERPPKVTFIEFAVVGISLFCQANDAHGQVTTETVVVTNDLAPDSNGMFNSFGIPAISAAGNAAFGAGLTGTSGGATDNEGVYLGSGLLLTQIAREGETAPDLNGTLSTFNGPITVNDTGEVGFYVHLIGTSGGAGDDAAIYRGTGGGLTTIVREGQAAPDLDGVYDVLSNQFGMNQSGAVGFDSSMSTTVNNHGVFRGAGGAQTQITRKNDATPDLNGTFDIVLDRLINDVGQVAFRSFISGASGGANEGVFIGSGGAVTQIVRQADVPVNGNGTFDFFQDSRVNDVGQVLFRGFLTGTNGGFGVDDQAYFLGSGGGLTEIVRLSDAIPLGPGTFSGFGPASLNDNGDVAFQSFMQGTPSGSLDNMAIFRHSGGLLQQISREGDPAPDGDGIFRSFNDPFLAPGGQVAFQANMDLTGNDVGIFLADDLEVIQLARVGQPLAGSVISTLTSLSVSGEPDRGGRSMVNEHGQVAYVAGLANGDSGVFIATPELHWRAAGSGDWDVDANWTVGLTPGEVHQVFIDPATAVTISGPAGSTTIRSLAVGGGGADVDLDMSTGSAISVDDTTSLPSGGSINVTAGSFSTTMLVMDGGNYTAPGVSGLGSVQFNSGVMTFTGAGGLALASSGPFTSNPTLGSNTTLNVTNTTDVQSGVTLDIGGGTLSTGSLTNSGGAVNFTSGTLHITSSDLTIASSGPLGDNLTMGAGKTLIVDQNLSVSASPGTLTVGGGTVDAASTTVNAEGLINITSGVLKAKLVNIDGGTVSIDAGGTSLDMGGTNGAPSSSGGDGGDGSDSNGTVTLQSNGQITLSSISSIRLSGGNGAGGGNAGSGGNAGQMTISSGTATFDGNLFAEGGEGGLGGLGGGHGGDGGNGGQLTISGGTATFNSLDLSGGWGGFGGRGPIAGSGDGGDGGNGGAAGQINISGGTIVSAAALNLRGGSGSSGGRSGATGGDGGAGGDGGNGGMINLVGGELALDGGTIDLSGGVRGVGGDNFFMGQGPPGVAGATGGLNLSGGTLTVDPSGPNELGNILIGGQFNFTSGTVHLRGPNGFTVGTGLVSTVLGGNALNIAANKTLDIDGSLTVPTGTSVTIDGGILDAAGTADIEPNASVTVNSGSMNLGETTAAPNSRIEVNGGSMISGKTIAAADSLIAVNGGFLTMGDAGDFFGFSTAGAIDITATGQLELRSKSFAVLGPSTTINGGSLVAAGGIQLDSGAVIQANGTLEAAVSTHAGSTIAATGNLTIGDAGALDGFFSQGRLYVDAHVVTIDDANEAVVGSLTTLGDALGNPGTLVANNGLVVDFGKNVAGVGEVDTPDSAQTPLINNGSIVGNSDLAMIELSGYVKGVGTCDFCNISGTDAPGFSTAAVNRGSVSYNGTLEIEIGGTTPGSGHDQLNHILGAGTADLGGTLEVLLVNGFMPSTGQSFNILTASGGIGGTTFDTELLPDLYGGLFLDVLYEANLVTLIVAGVAGDYNLNGVVDAADYTVWRDTFGSTQDLRANGDDTGDSMGVVDEADYAFWKMHFGESAGSASLTSHTVPEPANLVLLMPAAAGWCLRRRAGQRERRLD